MDTVRRWIAALLIALVPGAALADSAVTSLSLGTSTAQADCRSNASVTWSFTYTAPPTTESFSITTTSGPPIGGFTQPSTVGGGGTFNGVFNAPISIPQPPNTLIGTYGAVGDWPPTRNTAEFFILYNCTTRQVLYQCSGNGGNCPRTANAALLVVSPPVPVDRPVLLAAIALVLAGAGAIALRARRSPLGSSTRF